MVTYEYDSASRMVRRTEGGTTTNYTWDGWDLIREEKTGTVTETTDYLVPFGEVLALERGGDWYYLHGDALSSTQLVTDESGHIVGRYIYGAWGEELHTSESTPGLLENKFVGGLGCRRDSATGLVYMRHRWYDPVLQRFISRDPIGLNGRSNLYAYPANPLSYVDPEGLLQRKSDGSLRVEVVEKVRSTSKDGRQWVGYKVYLFTDLGHPIRATYNASGIKDFDSDCHGLTFTSGEFWIDDDQVETLLKGDGYTEIPEGTFPLPGDLAIFRKNGKVVHSATIVVGGQDSWLFDISGTNPEPEVAPTSTRQSWGNATYYCRGSVWR